MKVNSVAGILAGVVLALSVIAPPPAAAEELEHIVAIVNDGVIMSSELNDAVEQVRRRLGRDAGHIPEEALRSQVLDQMILTRLQTQRAERGGLRISDQDLNRALARLAQQNGMSTQQFQTTLQRQGIDSSALRDRLRDELLMNKLRQKEVTSRVVVTDEDVDRYLESESLRVQENREYHIRHILIAVSDGADSDTVKAAKQRAEQLRQRAQNGESFSDLAIARSDGQKALKGGDMGWLSGGYMPTLFQEIVPQLDPGEVSDVFRGPSGFHLIKLVKVRGSGVPSTEDSGMVEEVHARHILLKPNEIRDAEQTREQAQQLRKRLLAGDDFGELAREYSDDTGSANQGGDLDWVQPSAYPRQFAEHLHELKAGEISTPFQTPDGWHIVQLIDRRERDKSEERRRNRARQAIARRKIQEESEVWLRKLRDEAYVDVRMEGYRGDASDE